MKKLILILSLMMGLQTYSMRSEAMVGMIGLGYAFDDGSEFSTNMAIWGVAQGAGGLLAGAVTAFFNPALGGKLALIGIVLDAEGKFPQKNAEAFFRNRYGFINNGEVIKELSYRIEKKYEAGMTEIHFLENEVAEIFSSEDLTEEQFALITNDLK